jgi:RND family efflux transporter MFP subunit
VLLFVGCAQTPNLVTADHTPRVVVIEAKAAPDLLRRTAHGVVEARRDALLSARLDGLFAGHLVKPGDRVRRGDALASFDPRQAQAQLAMAEADWTEATAVHTDSERTLTRVEALGDGASIAQRDAAVLGVARAFAALSRAKAQRDLARVRHDHHTLRAPFDGRVSWVDGEIGETVGAGTPLVRVVQIDELVIEIGLLRDEVDAARDPQSQFVVTSGYATQAARLDHVAVAADPQTLDWTAKLVFSPNPGIVAGSPARVDLQLMTPITGSLIPISALHSDLVHVVENEKIQARPVQVLAERGDQLVVDGLSEGDLVVVRSTSASPLGSHVQILRDSP